MGLKEEMEDFWKGYLAATKAKDVEKIANLYADDSFFAMPGTPIMKKKDIKDFYASFIDTTEFCCQKTVDLIEITADWCLTSGNISTKDSTGKVTEMWYVMNFRKVGGKWIIRSDCAGYTKEEK